jgi:hypothetical protein
MTITAHYSSHVVDIGASDGHSQRRRAPLQHRAVERGDWSTRLSHIQRESAHLDEYAWAVLDVLA